MKIDAFVERIGQAAKEVKVWLRQSNDGFSISTSAMKMKRKIEKNEKK